MIWPTLKAKLKAMILSEVTESVPALVPAFPLINPTNKSLLIPENSPPLRPPMTPAERARRYRAKKKENVTPVTDRHGPSRDASRTVTEAAVTPPSEVPLSILRSEERKKEGGGGDCARATEPLVSKVAFDLADEVMTILGIDLSFVPPAWCGFAMWLQAGLTSGWQPELVRLAARKVAAARRREGPPHSFRYLGKPIVREHELAALPVPVPRQISFPFAASNVVEIDHGRPNPSDWRARKDAGFAALAKLRERVERGPERGGGEGCG